MGLTFIKAATAAGSPATITFADGTGGVVFDNTYNEYQFYFVTLHPGSDNVNLEFQVNDTGDPSGDFDGSPIQSTFFAGAYHNEGDFGGNASVYETGFDLANASDSYQHLASYVGYENDESCSGVLTLYDPSSNTYVKHFTSRINSLTNNGYTRQNNAAGYINDVTPIDEINFRFSSGSIDSGTIYMYGVS